MNKKYREGEKYEQKTYHRFGIDDRIWKKIKAYLTEQCGQYIGIAKKLYGY